MRIAIRIGTLDTITLYRVRQQIQATAPEWAEIIIGEGVADAQIVLAIGATGMPELVEKTPTILLQLCYESAHGGNKAFWDELWSKCLMVGSYFDLKAPNFVRFPMGYDPDVFYRDDSVSKKYNAIVFGEVDGPEEIKSVIEAFDVVAHIAGTSIGGGIGYVRYDNIPDDRLRGVYQRSKYCIGLRRIEGFEMPIVEGAACGCIPVTFDLECYRSWFNDFAIFLDPEKDVASQLVKITEVGNMDDTPFFVSEVPDMIAVSVFEQQTAWKPFWEKLAEVSDIEVDNE